MNEREIIIHNPDSLPTVAIKDLKPLQGNLKTLSEDNYNKLKNSIIKFGFFVPIFMWNGYVLDGHGRQRVMVKEGWGNYKVPVVNIEAENELEAREKLLHITSQYQKITIEGLDEFYPDWQEIGVNFDGLPNLGEIKDIEKKDKQDQDVFGKDKTIVCPSCEYEFEVN